MAPGFLPGLKPSRSLPTWFAENRMRLQSGPHPVSPCMARCARPPMPLMGKRMSEMASLHQRSPCKVWLRLGKAFQYQRFYIGDAQWTLEALE